MARMAVRAAAATIPVSGVATAEGTAETAAEGMAVN